MLERKDPPKYLIRLLRWFCDPELLEDVLGDLIESYYEIYTEDGAKRARVYFLLQTILLFRPGIIRNLSLPDIVSEKQMFPNYLKTYWRNVLKYKVFSTINVLSLTLGYAACIIIFLFIKDERSFDIQHLKRDNLYRLCEVQSYPGTGAQKIPLSMPAMGPTLVEDFPEVISYTRIWDWGKMLWEKDDKAINASSNYLVDGNFLTMFDFPLEEGDKRTALQEPNSIVISSALARKLFSNGSALSKSLASAGKMYIIKGVLQDVSENSHLQFDILISMATYLKDDAGFNDSWGSTYITTYLELGPNANIRGLEEKFPDYLRRHYSRVFGKGSSEDPTENHQLFLQPFSDIHLGSKDIEFDFANYRKFDGGYLDIFSLIGLCILFIASINFMNLTMARANHRSREVGVRKAIGARKDQLFLQFITESCLFALFSLCFAIVLGYMTLDHFNEMLGRSLSLDVFLEEPYLIMLGVASSLILGALSGLYPSIYLTSFKTVKVLKGMPRVKGVSVLSNILLMVQFGLAVLLIVGTIVVTQQLTFMLDKDPGFDKESILLIPMDGEMNKRYDALKAELLKNPNVLGVTASGQRLGGDMHKWGLKMKDGTGTTYLSPSVMQVDHDFIDVYGIGLQQGRNFDHTISSDKNRAYIINSSLASEWGGDNALEKELGLEWLPDDSLGHVIGIVDDFNFNSLHVKVENLVMSLQNEWGHYNELSIKLRPLGVEQGIVDVKKIYDKYAFKAPFEYSFLDSHLEILYRTDKQLKGVISIIALLSVLIGSMGLFGISAITAHSRTKEIGIRKVHGASGGTIIMLLSKKFIFMILFSFVLAAPIAYHLLSKWLNNFAYRIQVAPISFLIALIIVFFIAMFTISIHAFRSVRVNPVSSLRDE